MKNRIMILVIISIFTIANPIFAQNTNPIVSNVAFSISGTIVTVTYDVSDAEQNSFTVYMEVSSDGGATWNYNYGTATGDIGAGVAEGNGKSITWTYQGDYNPNFMIKILTDDLYGDQIYYAGQIYNTVTIGTQTWLKENLNVGTMINSTASGFQQTNNGVIEKYCYDNNPANCGIYGGLYEWPEAMQYTTNGAQGICPEGWHIPTQAEFETLKNFAGTPKKLVREDQPATFFYTPTNETGFSALFAGTRNYVDGGFSGLGGSTTFWSSTEYDSNKAYYMHLNNNITSVILNYYDKNYGFSVRCIKN
jgi:uncharacterized protein (TIGR02145 family)